MPDSGELPVQCEFGDSKQDCALNELLDTQRELMEANSRLSGLVKKVFSAQCRTDRKVSSILRHLGIEET